MENDFKLPPKVTTKIQAAQHRNCKSNSFYYDFDIEIVFSVNDGHHRRFFGRVTQARLSTRLPWGACVSKNFHLHLGRAADWKGKSINFKEGGFKFRVQVWWQKAISQGVTIEAGKCEGREKGAKWPFFFQRLRDYGIMGLLVYLANIQLRYFALLLPPNTTNVAIEIKRFRFRHLT